MRKLLEWVATLAVAAAVVLVCEAEVAKPYRIPSASMEPTLHCAKPTPDCEGHYNDRVIADRLSYVFGSPKRGQIIVFKAPPAAAQCGGDDAGHTFVKRLIGLPGDDVSERGGFVYVDGRKLDEPYVDPQLRDTRTQDFGRVGKGQYFFMGDDRIYSCDSRTWGTVPRSNLIGRVVFTYFPLNRIGFH
jgi:signal peptidase I